MRVGLGFDGGQLGGIGVQGVGYAAGAFDACEFQTGEAGGGAKVLHHGAEIGGVGALGGVDFGRCARGE